MAVHVSKDEMDIFAQNGISQEGLARTVDSFSERQMR